jgi:hypothetical protein
MPRYNPAEKPIERFPRYPRPNWQRVQGVATLICGCGEPLFRFQKTSIKRQRRTTTASHRKIVAVCPNPKCQQRLRID